jgi:RNA polymerase sigma-70 factor (ECF subfamily)
VFRTGRFPFAETRQSELGAGLGMTDKEDLIVDQIPHLRRYAAALLRDRDAADDLVQDCLTRAFDRLHLWRPSGTIRTWLFTILHNLHANQTRKRSREPEIRTDTDALERQPAQTDPDTGLITRDIENALEQLPDEQRSVILLVGLEGLSYADVAAITGAPLGTVMSRLSRGRERLRKIMEAQPESPLRRVK